jgi:hypothetical protein
MNMAGIREKTLDMAVKHFPVLRDILRLKRWPYPYRAFSRRHRCVFIHVPRTGGSSVLEALGTPDCRYHAPYWVYMQADPRKFAAYFKFSFVRNPWDRAVSTYFYLREGGCGPADASLCARINARCPTFDSFVMDFLTEETIHEHGLFVPQYLFLYDHAGTCMMDFVGRFENMAKDFATVAERIGLRRRELAQVNESRHADIAGYYADRRLSDKIARLYRRDAELFGYAFDGKR